MEIKILGGGCPKCERLEAVTREVVDEEVLSSGRIPSFEEIRGWLAERIG